MRIVVALGGNALLRRGEPLEAGVQRAHVVEAATSVAALARMHDVVVTHGNGPQVGLLALQAEAYRDVAPYPLDVLGAETEGMIGYLIEQALRNALPGREVAGILTEVVVDATDPAFARPTKPVGPLYSENAAARLAAEQGWTVAADGAGFRRVVPSPEPKRIVEIETIAQLVAAGVIVVCGGGGGIPVVEDPVFGTVSGVEAVIDKDKTASLMAVQLGADLLLLLTDVESVRDGWGGPDARPIDSATVGELRRMEFASGSMGPKIEAACRFVEATGHEAAIGSLERAVDIVAGGSGTRIRRAAIHLTRI